jgi:hypothetical protein
MTFKREERYYVLKISDMRKYLSREKFELVGAIAEKLNAGRAVDGKSLLQAVVVEHDWPEYERVWQMIETRVVTTRRNFLNCNNDRRFWPISSLSAEIVTPAVMKALSDFHLPATQTQEAKQAPVVSENTSDGYHTFKELYEYRKAYNIALFNEWAANGKCSVHKSWRHNDGELCFGGDWFIVVAVLPQGQISNHYEAKDWDLFQIQETEKALFEFDGHTGINVIERLKMYTASLQPIKPEQDCSDAATIAGLNTSVGHLSNLVDQQYNLLSEVVKVFGVDDHGLALNEGEAPLIDKIEKHLGSICVPQPKQLEQAPWGDYLKEGETPFERFMRERKDGDALLRLYRRAVAENEQLKTQQQELCGEAYLCNSCKTPFDGAFQCPSCGHGCATKEPVYTHLPIPTAQPEELKQDHVGYHQLFNAIAAATKTPYEGAITVSVKAFKENLGSEIYTTQPQCKQLPREAWEFLKHRRADTHSCFLLVQDLLALLADLGIKEEV